VRFSCPTLGKPPSHWRCERNRVLFELVDERTGDGTEDDLLSVSHLTGVTRRADKDVTMFLAESFEAYKHCEPGDLVVNTMWAWMGALGVSPLNGIISPSYHVYRMRNGSSHPKYFDYLFRTPAYVAEITRQSTGVWTSRLRLYPDVFFDMECFVPPAEEQRAIADYLDRKTAAIDALIEKKERLITLLAEKRAALINQAVTKGLNPDAPMKDSGVPWIGEIPAHWEVTAARWLAESIQTGVTPPTSNERYYIEGTVPWYGPGSLADGLDIGPPVKMLNRIAIADGVARLLLADTVLVVGIGATLGRVGLLTSEGTTNQQIIAIRFRKNRLKPIFAAYQMLSLERVFRNRAQYTTLPIMNQFDFGSTPCVVPPLAEQQEIEALINRSEADCAKASTALSSQINKLREYRRALITAAVTGQIDVTKEAA
jgi:type I restriction enzyme S subunit